MFMKYNNIVKMVSNPIKSNYRSNATIIKISIQIFTEIENINLNFICKHTKKTRIVKTILKNRRIIGGITTPDYKLHYRAMVIRNSMVLV